MAASVNTTIAVKNFLIFVLFPVIDLVIGAVIDDTVISLIERAQEQGNRAHENNHRH